MPSVKQGYKGQWVIGIASVLLHLEMESGASPVRTWDQRGAHSCAQGSSAPHATMTHAAKPHHPPSANGAGPPLPTNLLPASHLHHHSR